METKDLIVHYEQLRKMIDREGPGPRVRAVRSALYQIYRSYRAQQRYERLKRKTGVVIEFFECDHPLTKEDDRTLREAAAMNRQIGVVLREMRSARLAATQ